MPFVILLVTVAGIQFLVVVGLRSPVVLAVSCAVPLKTLFLEAAHAPLLVTSFTG